MTAPPSNAPSRPRRRILLVGGVVVLLLGGGLLAGVYRRLTNPERVRAFAQAELTRLTGADVLVGRAALSVFGGLRLSEVSIRPKAARDAALPETVFDFREIIVAHDPVALLRGGFQATALTAVEPTLNVIHDAATGLTNLHGLFQVHGARGDVPTSWPTVELRRAKIRVLRRENGADRALEELQLTLRGRPTQGDPGRYDVVWHDEREDTSGHAQVELATGYLRNVRGGLPSMSIEAVMLAVATKYDAAVAWSDLLGLDGRVRAENFDLIETPDHPRSATISLEDTSLSIPVDAEEGGLDAEARYLRFKHVRGQVAVTPDAIRADFVGAFHGAEGTVSATFRGGVAGWTTLNDVDFDAELTLRALTLPRGDPDAPPEQRRFVRHWTQLTAFMGDYDPHGDADVRIAVTKRAGDERVQVRRAVLTARGGDASARWFPYRLMNLGGSLEYAQDGVRIRRICGEHEGGTVCVEGQFERPDRLAAGELRISGTGVPIDHELIDGLEDRFRRVVDPLSPSGRVGVKLRLTRASREAEPPATWTMSSEVRLAEVTAQYSGFPIPMEHLQGVITATHDSVEVGELHGMAGGAALTLSGSISLGSEHDPRAQLTVEALGATCNDELLGLLPDEFRKTLLPLHPAGPFDVRLSFGTDARTGRPVTHAVVKLVDVSVSPEVFPIEVRGLTGTVEVSPEGVRIGPLSGQRGSSTFMAVGNFEHRSDGPSSDLRVTTHDFQLDDAIRQAAPEPLRGALGDWRVDGPINLDLRIRRSPSDLEPVLEVKAGVDDATVEHTLLPLPLTHVRGELTADATGARGRALRALYAGAEVALDFETRHAAGAEEGSLSITATDVTLDAAAGRALPATLRPLWERAAPRGRIDLHLPKLTYRNPDGHDAATWSVDGRVTLHDVAVLGLAELEHLEGTLSLSGDLVDERGGTLLGGSMQLHDAEFSGRAFSNLESKWSLARSADGNGRLALEQGRGAVYDGAVSGDVQWLFGAGRSEYHASAMVYGLQLAPWIDAGRRRSPGIETATEFKPSQARGVTDISLYLSGDLGNTLTREGGGRVEIREGRIYRLPLLLAILNVLNMNLPGDEPAQQAQASFYIVGDTLKLDDIQLRGGPLNLVGSGTVYLPDQALDLRLVTTGASAWSRIPLFSDLVAGATREFVELRVTGPLSRPTVRSTPFRGVTDELRRLFQKKPPKPVAPPGS